MRFWEWLQKQQPNVRYAILAAVVGLALELILLVGMAIGLVISWAPAAIVLIGTLVVAGGIYRGPEGTWGD